MFFKIDKLNVELLAVCNRQYMLSLKGKRNRCMNVERHERNARNPD